MGIRDRYGYRPPVGEFRTNSSILDETALESIWHAALPVRNFLFRFNFF
jgi:hypothetical protein